MARWSAFNRPRTAILSFAIPVLVLKLVIAARTFGTNDIAHWQDFLNGVRTAGPVGIYGLTFERSFYNHPPVAGYFLWLVNGVQNTGIPFNFTIRAVASLADVGSAIVLFELLRRRRSVAEATLAGMMVAVSPLLFVVSSFHGNTDPDFVFLTILGVYLLVDRKMSACAGAVIALALGVKIVPAVVVPVLLVYAWKQGRRPFLGFTAAGAAVFAATWGPALVLQFGPLRADVLGYGGNGSSLWGFMQIGHWLGDPAWVGVAGGPGRMVLVAVCALVPALAVWRRPAVVLPAVAWSFLVFLAFATTFGVQYLVWPVVVGYLIGFRSATLYNVSAGVILVEVYNRWSGGLPWGRAYANEFTGAEKVALLLPWAVLLLMVVRATMLIFPGLIFPGLIFPRVIFPREVAGRAPETGSTASSPAPPTTAVGAGAAPRTRRGPVPPQEAIERNTNAAQDG